MYDDLERAAIGLAVAQQKGVWTTPPSLVYFSEPTRDDRKLLAAHLARDEWVTVCQGLANLVLVSGASERYVGKPIEETKDDLNFPVAVNRIEAGKEALRRLADLPLS